VCGFIGGTEPDWRYEQALATIRHRGPDAAGLSLDGPVRVGFRRLAIIDLADAAKKHIRLGELAKIKAGDLTKAAPAS